LLNENATINWDSTKSMPYSRGIFVNLGKWAIARVFRDTHAETTGGRRWTETTHPEPSFLQFLRVWHGGAGCFCACATSPGKTSPRKTSATTAWGRRVLGHATSVQRMTSSGRWRTHCAARCAPIHLAPILKKGRLSPSAPLGPLDQHPLHPSNHRFPHTHSIGARPSESLHRRLQISGKISKCTHALVPSSSSFDWICDGDAVDAWTPVLSRMQLRHELLLRAPAHSLHTDENCYCCWSCFWSCANVCRECDGRARCARAAFVSVVSEGCDVWWRAGVLY